MNNYRNNSHSSTDIIMLIVCLIIMFVMIRLTNSKSDHLWNNGVCANCDTRYELRGIVKSLKYYACPDCEQEFQRY